MNALHFGAGNIGRGFIGLLLERAGYSVTFVDVNETIVYALQTRHEYTVELADGTGASEIVRNVTAIDGRDLEQVANAIATADLVTTAIGVNVLKIIAKSIAQGITKRMENHNTTPLHIIACENTIGGSSQLKAHVYEQLDSTLHAFAEQHVSFPDAAVDRIVPLQHHEDPLHVLVEPFFEWVVDRSVLFPSHTEIAGVHYVDQLIPYIERKLFTVNTGHCCAAYYGYLAGYETIQQAMQDEVVVTKVRDVLYETGNILITKYSFDATEHHNYIEKIVERFKNPYLTDEITRVGRSPMRKLSAQDRLIRPALLGYELNLPVTNLVGAIVAALKFNVEYDEEAVAMDQLIVEKGIEVALTEITQLPSDHPLHQQVITRWTKEE